MILKRISVVNYKNLEEIDIDFSDKINCFIGDNGAGKTNLLDAIRYLSFCKSENNISDSLVMRHNSAYFAINGQYLNEKNEMVSIACSAKTGAKKVFKYNDKKYNKLSEHIGKIPIVYVSPYDITLISGHSDERRRMMDIIISQYDKQYILSLLAYNKALQQRNALLKQENTDNILFDIIEEQMANAGELIFEKRKAFIAQLTPAFQEMYSAISGEKESVLLNYKSHCFDKKLTDLLQESRTKDKILTYTTCGIHRDDLEMLIDDYPIKREGSQGQTKSYVTALKFAQFKLLKNILQSQQPILLLDDVFDKLDAQRVEQIIRITTTNDFGQIFITDTNRNHLDELLQRNSTEYKLFSVSNGNISNI